MGSRWNSWLREDFICSASRWPFAKELSNLRSTQHWGGLSILYYFSEQQWRWGKELDLSLWHWPAAHTQRPEVRSVGRRWNHNWESGKHDPGVSSSILEGTELEGSTVQGCSMWVCAHVCVLSMLGPTPAVAPGFPAQLSSASLARHCHLFVEGNTVIWSFSIKMWVVAWDTSNDANIHTLLHSLWAGMCNLGAIYKHSLARHPHFCDLQLSTGIMKLQRLILNLETDEFPCLSSVALVKIVKIIITTMLICYYGYTLFK